MPAADVSGQMLAMNVIHMQDLRRRVKDLQDDMRVVKKPIEHRGAERENE